MNLVSLLTTTPWHGRPPDDGSLTNPTAVTERLPGERNENGGKKNLRRSQRLAETRLRKVEKAEPVAAGESTGVAVNSSRRKKQWHEEMEMEDDDGDFNAFPAESAHFRSVLVNGYRQHTTDLFSCYKLDAFTRT